MYRIEFPISGIVQYKLLISHQAYLDIKPLPNDLYKIALKELTAGNEWFTEKGAYYLAITTGRFVCNSADVPCIVTNNRYRICNSIITIRTCR